MLGLSVLHKSLFASNCVSCSLTFAGKVVLSTVRASNCVCRRLQMYWLFETCPCSLPLCGACVVYRALKSRFFCIIGFVAHMRKTFSE